MANLNWPLVVTQCAFNSAPNDPARVPVWTDLSSRVRKFSHSRGRQYEIDQNQAGEAEALLSDRDEVLNPANTASPYWPNILPYREILRQAMWPPAPVGAAVNILNATSGYDPSFETTAIGAAPPNLITFATVPLVVAGTAQSGANSLRWTVVIGGNQFAAFTVPSIPGRVYTASLYVRQTAANTTTIFINGGASGTSTTTTGAYVRLSVTYTATAPTHIVVVGSFTVTIAGTVNLDAVQVEPGASASTFSTTGPVIYGTFRGFVERWPASWTHQGTYGLCEIKCVDPLGILARTQMHTEFRNAVVALAPAYYWVLDEPSGSTTFGDKSGNNGPPLVKIDSSYGPAVTFVPATTMGLAGDPDGVGVAISTPDATPGPTVVPQPASVLETGALNTSRQPTPGIILGSSPPFAYSVAVITSRTDSLVGFGSFWLVVGTPDFTNRLVEISSDYGFDDVSFSVGPSPAFSVGPTMGPDVWDDGRPHLYVITVDFSATIVTINGYIDGAPSGVNTMSSLPSAGWNYPLGPLQVQLGGFIAEVTTTWWGHLIDRGPDNGVHAHLAAWRRVLSPSEVSGLWYVAAGAPNETSGYRVARYLTYGYTGPVTFDVGASVMGVSDLSEGTAILDAAQQVAASENGNFFADGEGVVTFTSRTRRYMAVTSKWSFGEQESPYQGNITFDMDPTRVANRVQITRSGGVIVVAADATSQQKYFTSSFERTLNIASDAEATDAANYFLSQMKDPHLRVRSVVLEPSSNPALWPVALGVEIGDRSTVKRRTSAGLVISADFFVEKISHAETPGSYTVTLELSPASALGATPWILQDATYGMLEQTTILGY